MKKRCGRMAGDRGRSRDCAHALWAGEKGKGMSEGQKEESDVAKESCIIARDILTGLLSVSGQSSVWYGSCRRVAVLNRVTRGRLCRS